jgi:O-antigen ligase
MRQFLLVGLFAILLGDIMLGLGLTLGPGLSLKNAVLYVLFVALVFEFTTGRRDPLREVWTLNVAWFALVSFATFTWMTLVLLGIHRGYDSFGSFVALKSQLVDLFLFMLVYMYGPKDLESTARLLKWLISVLVIVNVVTMIDTFNVPDLGIVAEAKYGRLAGPVNEVNQYGAILIFIIPITAGLALGSHGWARRMFAVGAIIAFVLLGLTVSRGSFLGLFVGGMVAIYLARDYVSTEKIVKGAVLVTTTIIIVSAIVIYQNPEGVLQKFDVAGATLEGVSSGRTILWRQALTMMSVWPLSFITGYGWNGYTALFIGYGDPHNTYLLYWFNLGIFGLSAYLFIMFWIVRFSVRSLEWISADGRPIVIGFLIGFLALHAALFFVELYAPWMFIWAIAGTTIRYIVEQGRLTTSEPLVEVIKEDE